MQWNNGQYSGFSAIQPWIKLNKNYPKLNVSSLEKDKNSLLNTYKNLIALRNSEPILQYGAYEKLEFKDDRIHFIRNHQESRINVVINFGKPYTFKLPNNVKVLLGSSTLLTNDFLIFKE